MPGYVLAVDVLAVVLLVIGFHMAFRQSLVRRLLGRPARHSCDFSAGEGVDPLTYVLRIAGVMIMVFGIAIGGMLTLFHLA